MPFQKELASDELSQVPNMPLVLNSLCRLIKMQVQVQEDEDLDQEEIDLLLQIEQAQCEICNTISVIAQEGISAIREQEASIEDKMLYGTSSSPMKRLYEKGTRNLIAISKSEVPETLVSILALGIRSNDMIIAAIEAIGHTSLYVKVAERYGYMGVIKDLVKMFTQSDDFRSYQVSIAMDAIWNLVEVVGQKAIAPMAQDLQLVMGLKRPFENVVKKGYKLDDKCLRNELAILINYLVMEKDSHPILFEKVNLDNEDDGKSLFDAVMHYATVDEFYAIEQGDYI